MAGFDFERGRSNNMIEAEERGMITVGRWARRFKVSARAAQEVMQPTEAHHTGTGHRGKSRLTAVIASDAEPTPEQLAAMQAWDRGDRPTVRGWYTAWEKTYDGPYGRRRNVPYVALFEGDAKEAPRGLQRLSGAEYERAAEFKGCALLAYADKFDEVRTGERAERFEADQKRSRLFPISGDQR